MPTLMGKYVVKVTFQRVRRVRLGMWLMRIGARLSGVTLEIEAVADEPNTRA